MDSPIKLFKPALPIDGKLVAFDPTSPEYVVRAILNQKRYAELALTVDIVPRRAAVVRILVKRAYDWKISSTIELNFSKLDLKFSK